MKPVSHKYCIAVALALFPVLSLAASQVPPSAPVTVVNTPANPVPISGNITGTVTLEGVGAISGAVESADQNVTVYNDFIRVTTVSFGNAQTPVVDVKDFKEVRVTVERGSCGPCSDPVEVFVTARPTPNPDLGFANTVTIDSFKVDQPAFGVGFFVSRTYRVPGDGVQVWLRNPSSGASNSVNVVIVGRAN